MSEGKGFALRELLMYTAAILTMYEIRPPEGKQWTIPGTRRQGVTKHPKKAVRVWIKRRELPMEK